MASHMEAHRLEIFLVHVLSPVYRITEDDTIRDPQMGECLILFYSRLAYLSIQTMLKSSPRSCRT